MSISFLEAKNITSSRNEYETKTFILAASGQTENLNIFIKASCILNGFNCNYTTLPFNTLQQYLSTSQQYQKTHIFLLFPWDIIPETDWRTGVTQSDLTLDEIQTRINSLIKQINHFPEKHVIYIPAKILPVTYNYNLSQQIECQFINSLLKIDAAILTPDCFSLTSYTSNGCAVSSKKLSDVSSAIASSLIDTNTNTKKILITDFDNVMWRGVIGEDGIEGIQCDSEGAGFIHYIYQSFLLKLKSQGILLVGVTRNDEELAILPFKQEKTLLKTDDFISIVASYHPKSSQINQVLKDLNLPIDSVVFVDDNPLELEEVKTKLSTITCLPFPSTIEYFPLFLVELQKLFSSSSITDDDKKRTDLYKIRYKMSGINTEQGADLTEYLTTLSMQLTIKKCDTTNFLRPLQLINKTNQFNLNGIRLTDTEIIEILSNKSTLHTFSLKDKFGDHGQIACVILSSTDIIQYFVMSCRVFQRQIEYAIIFWLIKHTKLPEIKFNFKKTSKNIPFQMMIENELFFADKNLLKLDTKSYVNKYSDILKLFNLKEND